MDEFTEDSVSKVSDNISQKESQFLPQRSIKMREFLKLVISSADPEIKITNINEEGDIVFLVNMRGLGLSEKDFNKYKSEIFMDFTANFLGEFLVRENINSFAKILIGINLEEYDSVVNGYEHKRFGMEVSSCIFKFSFHVSLLQDILKEGFKKKCNE